MLSNSFKVISVMSGTSLDGIDILYSEFVKKRNWTFKIVEYKTVAYSSQWRKNLKHLIDYSKDELKLVDLKYSEYLGNEILNFIKSKSIKKIDFIASHGHTALHKPDEGLTYQIGNKQILSDITKNKVICDFRIQDVKFGGQGAPLVPIGDKLLFSDYDYCINLGGFANISYEKNNMRMAFDICPANIVLNKYSSKLGFEYDEGGKIAISGSVDKSLLKRLNELEYYKLQPPKSLGLEWVEAQIFPIINEHTIEVKDIIRTFVEHCAIKISNCLKKENSKALFTGGGVYNSFLIQRIENYSKTKIIIPQKPIIEYKEALIFGFLGVLKDRDEVNCLKSVTGANMDHSSGVILYPRN